MKLRLPLSLLAAVLGSYSSSMAMWSWQGGAGEFGADDWHNWDDNWVVPEGEAPTNTELGPGWRSSQNWGGMEFNAAGEYIFSEMNLEGWNFMISALNGAQVTLNGTTQKMQGPESSINIDEDSKLIWNMNMAGNGITDWFNTTVLAYEGLVFETGWKGNSSGTNITLGSLGSIHSKASNTNANISCNFSGTLLQYGEEGFSTNAGQYGLASVSFEEDGNYVVYTRRLWSVEGDVDLRVTLGNSNSFSLLDGTDLAASSIELTAGSGSVGQFYLYESGNGEIYVSYGVAADDNLVEYLESTTITWTGDTGTWDGSTTNWENTVGETVSFSDGSLVVFDAEHAGTVTISGEVSPLIMHVTGGEYEFVGADENSSLTLTGSLAISGGAHTTFSGTNDIAGSVSVDGPDTVLTLSSAAAMDIGKLTLFNGATLELQGGTAFAGYTAKENSDGTILLGSGTTMGQLLLEGGSVHGDVNSLGAVSDIRIYASAGNGGKMALSGVWHSTGRMKMVRGNLTISGSDTAIVIDNYFDVGENTSAFINNILMEDGLMVVKGAGSHSGTDFSIQLANWGKTTNFQMNGGELRLARQLTVAEAGSGLFEINDGFAGMEGINMMRNVGSTTSATLNLNGGTLVLGNVGIRERGSDSNTALEKVHVNLNGGTLGASADWTLGVPATLGGYVEFDTTGYSVAAADDLLEYTQGTEGRTITVSGVLSGDGGIVADGAGTLALTGANTYTGGTTVRSGTLTLGSASAIGTGSLKIHRGATVSKTDSFADVALSFSGGSGIAIGAGSGTATLSGMGLTLGESSLVTVDVGALDGMAGSGNALLSVEGAISLSGTGHQIALDGFDVLNPDGYEGTYVLATGTSLEGWTDDMFSSLALDSNISSWYSWDLSASGNNLVLTLTSTGGALTWNGAESSGTWVAGGESVWLLPSGAPSAYEAGRAVVFADLTIGEQGEERTILLEGALNPASISFANDLDSYVLSSESGGSLTGAVNIVKEGTAEVTLATDNSEMSGGTIDLREGTLVVGHANALGNNTVVFAGGVLEIGVADATFSAVEGTDIALQVDGDLSWSATAGLLADKNIVKTGTGTLVLSETSYGNLASSDGGTIELNVASGTATIPTTASLSGHLMKTGEGTLSLGGNSLASSQNLTLDIQGGIVDLSESVTSGDFDINLTNATLRLDYAALTINGVSGQLTMGAASRLILYNGNMWGTTFGMPISVATEENEWASILGTWYGNTTISNPIVGQGNLQITTEHSNILIFSANSSYQGDTAIGPISGGIRLNFTGAIQSDGSITPWGIGDVSLGVVAAPGSTVNGNTQVNVSPSGVSADSVYSVANNISIHATGGNTSLNFSASGTAVLNGMLTVTTEGEYTTTLDGGSELRLAGGLAGSGNLNVFPSSGETDTTISTITLGGDTSGYTGTLASTMAHVKLASTTAFGGSINTGGNNLLVASAPQTIVGSLTLGAGDIVIDSSVLNSAQAALTLGSGVSFDAESFSLTLDNSGNIVPDVDGRYCIVANATEGMTAEQVQWAVELDADIGRFYSFSKIDNAIYLTVAGLTSVLWVGDTDTGNGTWAEGTVGWMDGTVEYSDNKAVSFMDIASSSAVISIGTTGALTVTPESISVSSDSTDYTWEGPGTIGDKEGTQTSLSKVGEATLTINQDQANTFSGGTRLANGRIVLQSVGGLGTGSIVLEGGQLVLDASGEVLTGNALQFNGGTLVYSAGASQDVSGLIDVTNSTGVVNVNVLSGGLSVLSSGSQVSWATDWASIDKDLVLNASLAQDETAGDLQISVGASTDANMTVSQGSLIVQLSGSPTLSGAISGAGNLVLQGGTEVSLTGTYDDFSGNLTMSGSNTTIRLNDSALLANAASISVDGVAWNVGNGSAVLLETAIDVGSGGLVLQGTADQTWTLAGAITGAGNVSLGGEAPSLALTGDLSSFTGSLTVADGKTLALGDGGEATLNANGALSAATAIAGAGNVVVNYANDVVLGAAVGGSVSLTQSGSGSLTLAGGNASTGTLTIDTALSLADGSGWNGVISGAGKLTTLASGDQSLDLEAGELAVEHGGTGTVALVWDDASAQTGSLSVSGGGILDLGGQQLSAEVVMVHGSLVNADNASNLHIRNTGDVDMGGVDGSQILSIEGSGGNITNISGNLTLSEATISIVEGNMDSSTHPGSAAVSLNDADATLTLDSLTVDVQSIESFLRDQRDEYNVCITNGVLAGAIVDDWNLIEFTPWLSDLGYDLMGVEGGNLLIDGRYVDTPYTVFAGETTTLRSPSVLTRYPSIFVNGTLNLNLEDGDVIVFKKLQSDAGMADAQINTGNSVGVTVELNNDGLDSQYAGDIEGAAAIVKTGANRLDIGGNVLAEGSSISVQEGVLTIGGTVTTQDLTVVGTADAPASLSIGGTATVAGTTTVGLEGTLTLNEDLTTGTLQLTDNGRLILNGSNVVLTNAEGSNTIGSNAVITGTGSLTLADGASLSVSGGSKVDAGIIFELGENWTLNAESDMTLAVLDGDNTLSIANGAVITLTGGRDADFRGELVDSSVGTIVKTGSGTQILRDSATGVNLDVRGGVMEINRRNVAEAVPIYNKLTVGSSSGNTAELIVRTDTRASSLLVDNSGTLTLGDADPNRQYAPVTLSLSGNGVFADGASLNTIVPNEEGGIVASGTITLPNQLNLSLVNNGSGSIATADDLLVMKAGGGFLGSDGSALAAGTSLDGWTVTLEKSISLFYSSATIHVAEDGVSLLATPSYNPTNTLLGYAQSDNARAGANLIWHAGIQAGGSNLDKVLSFVMDGINSGNTAGVSQAMAAVVGASVTAVPAAEMADFRNQQQLIRNRMTSMGLNPNYNYEGELPLFNAWIQGNGSYNELDGDGDAPGFRLNTWGGIAGVDANISANTTLGLAVTASYGDLTANGADSLEGDLDSYYVNLFGRYQSGKWGHNLILTGGVHDASTTRTVNVGGHSYQAEGGSDGMSLGAFYEVTRDISLNEDGTALLQPLFTASMAYVDSDDFSESGAGNGGLNVSDLEYMTGSVGLGVRMLGLLGDNLFGREALGEFRVQVVQDFGDDCGEARVGFQAAPGLTQQVRGAEAGRTGLQVGAGLTIPAGDNTSIFLDANADVRSGMTSANGSVGLRYNF